MIKMNPDTHLYDMTVVLINYNSSQLTIECVASILRQSATSLSYNIVIVDNASQSDNYKDLVDGLSQFTDKVSLQLFRSKINTGFSGGNMLGIQLSSAKYYFFLNNDCRLQNDCLDILYQFCEKNSDVALCSPQLFNERGEHQPCIDYFPVIQTKILGLGVLRLTYGKRFFKRKGVYTEPIQVDVVSGSQMFVRASAFNEAGGLDTTFFLYCEEEDIALRLANNGYKTYLVPEAKNVHIGGGSTIPSLDIRKEFYISFLYFYRKHYGYTKTSVLKLILFIRTIRKSFRNPENFHLAIFILKGAHSKYSLKHRQRIIDKL
ncbi:MAG: glycosyltransferase family 2 protein [Motiliproteus sp.]